MNEALCFLNYVFVEEELGSMCRVARALRGCESTLSRNNGALQQQLDIHIFQRHKNTEQLLIGLSAPFGMEFICRLVERFEKRYPQIEVILQDGSRHKQVNAICRRDLDIAFMSGVCSMRSFQY